MNRALLGSATTTHARIEVSQSQTEGSLNGFYRHGDCNRIMGTLVNIP